MAAVDERAVATFLAGDDITKMLAERAAALAAEVQRLVPRRTGAHSDIFARSITVGDPQRAEEGAVVPVQTSSPFWHIYEYGTITNEPYAPFRRAVVNLGFRLEELPKP